MEVETERKDTEEEKDKEEKDTKKTRVERNKEKKHLKWSDLRILIVPYPHKDSRLDASGKISLYLFVFIRLYSCLFVFIRLYSSLFCLFYLFYLF